MRRSKYFSLSSSSWARILEPLLRVLCTAMRWFKVRSAHDLPFRYAAIVSSRTFRLSTVVDSRALTIVSRNES